MLLTDRACRTAKPTASSIMKLSDGRGLQLWVHPSGSKLWRLAYRFGQKQKILSLGPYPTVSLADARDEREKAKKRLVKGIDPRQKRLGCRSRLPSTGAEDEHVGLPLHQPLFDEPFLTPRHCHARFAPEALVP
jgi:hypothetical protein